MLAQHRMVLHQLSHISHSKADNGSLLYETCTECLALSALGSAPPNAIALLLLTARAGSVPVARLAAVESPAPLRLAFHSRAPPLPC
jgi:hypothetical protein